MQDPRYVMWGLGFNIFFIGVKFGKLGFNPNLITLYIPHVFSLWSISTLIFWHLVIFHIVINLLGLSLVTGEK